MVFGTDFTLEKTVNDGDFRVVGRIILGQTVTGYLIIDESSWNKNQSVIPKSIQDVYNLMSKYKCVNAKWDSVKNKVVITECANDKLMKFSPDMSCLSGQYIHVLGKATYKDKNFFIVLTNALRIVVLQENKLIEYVQRGYSLVNGHLANYSGVLSISANNLKFSEFNVKIIEHKRINNITKEPKQQNIQKSIVKEKTPIVNKPVKVYYEDNEEIIYEVSEENKEAYRERLKKAINCRASIYDELFRFLSHIHYVNIINVSKALPRGRFLNDKTKQLEILESGLRELYNLPECLYDVLHKIRDTDWSNADLQEFFYCLLYYLDSNKIIKTGYNVESVPNYLQNFAWMRDTPDLYLMDLDKCKYITEEVKNNIKFTIIQLVKNRNNYMDNIRVKRTFKEVSSKLTFNSMDENSLNVLGFTKFKDRNEKDIRTVKNKNRFCHYVFDLIPNYDKLLPYCESVGDNLTLYYMYKAANYYNYCNKLENNYAFFPYNGIKGYKRKIKPTNKPLVYKFKDSEVYFYIRIMLEFMHLANNTLFDNLKANIPSEYTIITDCIDSISNKQINIDNEIMQYYKTGYGVFRDNWAYYNSSLLNYEPLKNWISTIVKDEKYIEIVLRGLTS